VKHLVGSHLLTLLSQPDDQVFPRRLDDFFGDRLKLVDLQDALHLHEQAVNQTHIACRDTHNGVHRLLGGPILGPSSSVIYKLPTTREPQKLLGFSPCGVSRGGGSINNLCQNAYPRVDIIE
jgi:hypothetical protein